MDYPYSISVNVEGFFNNKPIKITLYSGLTTFVGTNASGKTKTLKAIRDALKGNLTGKKVRYLSSNRIGNMEEFRSRASHNYYNSKDFSFGSRGAKQYRHDIETSYGDFYTMDERKDICLKVAERLNILFQRNIYLHWDSGFMKVIMEKTDTNKEYTIAEEASGLVNVISILAALYDDEVEVLLIDEPEVSLHPQLQSFLMNEMKLATSKYGKTVIISTHSIEMIGLQTAIELKNFVFFTDHDIPKQINPETPELANSKLREFVQKLGLMYKEGFFAKKILLVEGISDYLICRFLNNKLCVNLDAAGAQIIPVDGKGQFPVVFKLFRLIGKEVCVLTDLDGFVDNNDVVNLFTNLSEATQIANSSGNDNLQDMVRNIKTDLFSQIAADSSALKMFYEKHPYWLNCDEEVDKNIAVKRAVTAELFSCGEDILNRWPNYEKWKSLKKRLTVLLNSFEKLGCFVLRKGTIESYYSVEDSNYDKKPALAINEISEIDTHSSTDIEKQYDDVISSLKFVTIGQIVDESKIIKRELLSELALILGMLNEATTEKEILTEIKRVKGIDLTLFAYKVINENGRLGVEIFLNTKIMDVTGFPFKAFVGDHVNNLVEANVRFKE